MQHASSSPENFCAEALNGWLASGDHSRRVFFYLPPKKGYPEGPLQVVDLRATPLGEGFAEP